MARLFVVNATGQNMIVNYRTEFDVDGGGRRTTERNRPYRSITIAARQQVPFGGELSVAAVHAIVSQIEKSCCAVSIKEIRTAKAKGVVRMIWSLDVPIPVAVLKDVVQHNLGVMTEDGEERRRRLALGANFTMGNLSDPRTDTVRSTDVEFESVEQTEDNDLSSPSLVEGFKIAKPEPKPRGRARARA